MTTYSKTLTTGIEKSPLVERPQNVRAMSEQMTVHQPPQQPINDPITGKQTAPPRNASSAPKKKNGAKKKSTTHRVRCRSVTQVKLYRMHRFHPTGHLEQRP